MQKKRKVSANSILAKHCTQICNEVRPYRQRTTNPKFVLAKQDMKPQCYKKIPFLLKNITYIKCTKHKLSRYHSRYIWLYDCLILAVDMIVG